MCYCSVTVLTEERRQRLTSPLISEVAHFSTRTSIDEHFALDGPIPSEDEARRDVPEPPSTPITAIRRHIPAVDDGLSPPWAPRRGRRNAIPSEPISPLALLGLGTPSPGTPTHAPPQAPRRTQGRTEHIRFATPPSPTWPLRNGDGSRWYPDRDSEFNGEAIGTWAGQQYRSLPRFHPSPPPPRPLSPGEGPSGIRRRCMVERRGEEAARGPDYPEHAAFMGNAGAQDNGPYPAPPPWPTPQQRPQSDYQQRPRQSRFVRPPMTRWPTPQPTTRLDLATDYCPAHHAPGVVASSRTYFPAHPERGTFHSGSSNPHSYQNGMTSGFGNGSDEAGPSRHLNASSISPPSSSPPRQQQQQTTSSDSPGSSPPRHVYQAELDFVAPDEAVFSMAAATHPRPPAAASERRPNVFRRLRDAVRQSWRARRSRGGGGGGEPAEEGNQPHEVEDEAEGYEGGDEDSLEDVPLVPGDEDGNEGDDTEAWSEIGQPADSDSGEIVDGDEGEDGPSVVTEAVRSKERFSMD